MTHPRRPSVRTAHGAWAIALTSVVSVASGSDAAAPPVGDRATVADAHCHLQVQVFARRVRGSGATPCHVDVTFRFTSTSWTDALCDLRITSIATASGAALAPDPVGVRPGFTPTSWPLTLPGSYPTDPNRYKGTQGWFGNLPEHETLTIAGTIGVMPIADMRIAEVGPAAFGHWLSVAGFPDPVRVSTTPGVVTLQVPHADLTVLTGIFAYDAAGTPLQPTSGDELPDGTMHQQVGGVPVRHVQLAFIDPHGLQRTTFQVVTTLHPEPVSQEGPRVGAPPPRGTDTVMVPSVSLKELADAAIADADTPAAAPRGGIDPDAALTAYVRCMELLAAGQQAGCEALLGQACANAPADPQLAFLHACVTRSRFAIKEAATLFQDAARLPLPSCRARCCSLMLAIDAGQDAHANLDHLVDLARANPADPLLLWVLGMACRSLHANDLGIWAYTELQVRMSPGPVLMHQTWANLLDEAGRSPEAVPHRLLAIAMERESWSVSGLADTYMRMKSYANAARAYQEAVTLDVNDDDNWARWGHALALAGKDDDALAKANHALALNAANTTALETMIVVAEDQHRTAAAIQALHELLQVDPTDGWATTELQRLTAPGAITPDIVRVATP